jgi:hypothetical protein
VARLDRPVVGEEGALAVLVFRDQQAGSRDAPVAHDDRAPLAGPALRLEPDREPVVLVVEDEPSAALGHGADRHAPGDRRRPLHEIEREHLEPVLEDAEIHRGLALDLVRRVAERQPEGVLDDVYARLPRIGVGARCGRGEAEDGRRRQREQDASSGHGALAYTVAASTVPR